MVFEKLREKKGRAFEVERSAKFGGNVAYNSYPELENDFAAGKLHPMDLKATSANYIDQLIEPVRVHFEKNAKAKKLLEEINSYSEMPPKTFI